MERINIQGARIHNLKNINLSIPKSQLVVITGISGSGKSSLLKLILAEDSQVVAIFTGDNHFYHKGNLTDSVTEWVAAPAYAGDGMIIRVRGN